MKNETALQQLGKNIRVFRFNIDFHKRLNRPNQELFTAKVVVIIPANMQLNEAFVKPFLDYNDKHFPIVRTPGKIYTRLANWTKAKFYPRMIVFRKEHGFASVAPFVAKRVKTKQPDFNKYMADLAKDIATNSDITQERKAYSEREPLPRILRSPQADAVRALINRTGDSIVQLNEKGEYNTSIRVQIGKAIVQSVEILTGEKIEL